MIFLCSFITHDDKYAYIDDIDEVFYSRVDIINQSILVQSRLSRFLQGTNLFAQSRDFHQRERIFAKVFFRRRD